VPPFANLATLRLKIPRYASVSPVTAVTMVRLAAHRFVMIQPEGLIPGPAAQSLLRSLGLQLRCGTGACKASPCLRSCKPRALGNLCAFGPIQPRYASASYRLASLRHISTSLRFGLPTAHSLAHSTPLTRDAKAPAPLLFGQYVRGKGPLAALGSLRSRFSPLFLPSPLRCLVRFVSFAPLACAIPTSLRFGSV